MYIRSLLNNCTLTLCPYYVSVKYEIHALVWRVSNCGILILSIILLFLHLYCAILSYTHTWDDLHKSDSFENIPGMLSRQCQCMQWAGDCPVVTHCIRFKMMETPGPRGPGARSRYFGKDGEIRDIIKWRNAIAEISTPDSLTHPRKKFSCRFFSGLFHYILNLY